MDGVHAGPKSAGCLVGPPTTGASPAGFEPADVVRDRVDTCGFGGVSQPDPNERGTNANDAPAEPLLSLLGQALALAAREGRAGVAQTIAQTIAKVAAEDAAAAAAAAGVHVLAAGRKAP